MRKEIQEIQKAIRPLQEELRQHKLYAELNTLEDVKLFMKHHVFAVWDFMSLLKALQRDLTSVEVPWQPKQNAVTARFINEIVLAEETDLNESGEPRSHFEMYLDAMNQVGASTQAIENYLTILTQSSAPIQSLERINISDATKDFVKYTFEVIDSGKAHIIASAFTFGREDIIPDMFVKILDKADPNNVKYTKIRYYLDRHIELDGDEHGPLSLEMVSELCGDDEVKWEEVMTTAQTALEKRIELWDGITSEIITFAQILN